MQTNASKQENRTPLNEMFKMMMKLALSFSVYNITCPLCEIERESLEYLFFSYVLFQKLNWLIFVNIFAVLSFHFFFFSQNKKY